MNVQFRDRPAPGSSVQVKTAIADCDIHPARATRTELYPYLAKRWHAHLETYPRLQDGAQISDNAASKQEAVR